MYADMALQEKTMAMHPNIILQHRKLHIDQARQSGSLLAETKNRIKYCYKTMIAAIFVVKHRKLKNFYMIHSQHF